MTIQAIARIFLGFEIKVITGLHIGGTNVGVEIGGIDNPVIRDPISNRPYIPGSSLKGKMRCLLEKHLGLTPNYPPNARSKFHVCEKEETYRKCPVCRVFGIPGEKSFATPTRLVVRDILLSNDSAQLLGSSEVHTDLAYTEVKTEVAIDRITSAANPRSLERVPAGAVFAPGEIVYTIYSSNDGSCDSTQDVNFLCYLFDSMMLLEHDYLGGHGSRGSGKVAFQNVKISLRKQEDYFAKPTELGEFPKLEKLMAEKETVLQQIKQSLGLSG